MDRSLHDWLARIGLDRAPPADAAGLALLQDAQRRSIPFENLDILLGRGIAIDPETVFEKLVTRRRGGYCFEQNRLFADMLRRVGFDVRPLLARVRLNQPEDAVPPRTHTLLLVRVGGAPWIADAGFGGSGVLPLALRDGASAQAADGAVHRLRRTGQPGSLGGEWLLERSSTQAGDWQAQYTFDLAEVGPEDLEMGNHWTSTRAGTRFTVVPVVSIVLPDGFAALSGCTLTVTRSKDIRRSDIPDAEDYRRSLRDIFRLQLSMEEVAALPPFLPVRG
ncbi:arylamine N-acetyltransferase family protein [Altericroceibacterium xinjiangense]|uniref:arylamine N-acetyltransferase family protein n=1 Tax=Altericroceibacterium xinjiangense TaxID=762261 RepID=UPI000F7E0250|nr:arylamine N-acetyltransferase [Altericroceibacterium xinjiangense]